MLDESLKEGQRVVVGLKQTGRALEKDNVRSVYVAKDADNRLIQPIIEMCKAREIQILEVPSMTELGKTFGIKVGAAVVAILNS